jgi:hypothetical protein
MVGEDRISPLCRTFEVSLDCAKEGDHSTDANVVLYRPAAVSAAAQVGLTGVGMPVAWSELPV